MTGDLLGNASTNTATWTYAYNVTAGVSKLLSDVYGPTNGTVNSPVYLHQHFVYGDSGNSSTYPFLPIENDSYNAPGTASANLVSIKKFTYGFAANATSSDTDPAPAAYGLLRSTYIGDSSGNGSVTMMKYDGRGYVSQTVKFSALQGAPAISANLQANATISFNPASDLVSNYTVDLRGLITQEQDPGGKLINYSYDNLGRPTSVLVTGGNISSLSQTYYDGNGLVTWFDGPRYGAAEDYIRRSYTPLGQVSAEIRWRTRAKADGSGVEQVPGADQMLGQTLTTYTYDAAGNLLTETDSNGNSKQYTYGSSPSANPNAACLPVKVQSFDSSHVLLNTTTYTYEPGGKVAKLTVGASGDSGGNSQLLTQNSYTATGQIEKQINPNGTQHLWTYYEDGRVHTETLENGLIWTTTYNDASHTTTRTFNGHESAAVVSGNATTTSTGDVRGNILNKTDLDGFTFSSTYDALNRPVSETGPTVGNVTQNTTFAYDVGNLTQTVTRTNPVTGNDTTVSQTDILGRTVSVKVFHGGPGGTPVSQSASSYSADQISTTITVGTGNTALSHTVYSDESGHPVLTQYPDGTFTLQAYDANGNLISSQDEDRAGDDLLL